MSLFLLYVSTRLSFCFFGSRSWTQNLSLAGQAFWVRWHFLLFVCSCWVLVSFPGLPWAYTSTDRSVILLLRPPHYLALQQFPTRSGWVVFVLSWLTANYIRRLLLFVTWVVCERSWCSICHLKFYTIYRFNIFSRGFRFCLFAKVFFFSL